MGSTGAEIRAALEHSSMNFLNRIEDVRWYAAPGSAVAFYTLYVDAGDAGEVVCRIGERFRVFDGELVEIEVVYAPRWPPRVGGCASGRGLLAVVLCASVLVVAASRCRRSRPRPRLCLDIGPGRRTRRSSTARDRRARSATGPIEYPGPLRRPGTSRFPPRSVIAGRPGVQDPACQGERVRYADVATATRSTACESNFIAYDDVALFRDLARHVRPVLGRARARARVGPRDPGPCRERRRSRPIYKELQADCFAGACTRPRRRRRQRRSTLEAGRPRSVARGAARCSATRPGTSPDDPSAHGSAFDRVSAFQDGFESGAEQCADLLRDAAGRSWRFRSRTLEEADERGRDPRPRRSIPLTVDLLNDFYSQVEPSYVPLSIEDFVSFDSSKRSHHPEVRRHHAHASSRSRTASSTASTTATSRSTSRSSRGLRRDRRLRRGVADREPVGDARPDASRRSPGVADNGLEVVFQADCYSGGWTAALFNGAARGRVSCRPATSTSSSRRSWCTAGRGASSRRRADHVPAGGVLPRRLPRRLQHLRLRRHRRSHRRPQVARQKVAKWNVSVTNRHRLPRRRGDGRRT